MDKARQRVVFLLVMAGCGGMLFDFGGTIINPAIPYLESLRLYTTAELSHLTSAVVMSAALAGLFAGTFAEWLGRKKVMLIAAAIAGLACLPICLAPGYWPFYAGRTLQGVAAGLIGVVVPMYLAECLDAKNRGKGAGIFQFMDVIGILFCSLVGVAVVNTIGGPNDPAIAEAAKNAAWKAVFWTSAVPAAVFFIGALGLKESPVWLEKKAGKVRSPDESLDPAPKDSVFRRKYVLPFVLAVAVLACNQATGCNAIQYFALKMFMDAGLGDSAANYANVALWAVMLGMTAVACTLVDRKGRTFLLKIGTAGMVVSDVCAGFVCFNCSRCTCTAATDNQYICFIIRVCKVNGILADAAVRLQNFGKFARHLIALIGANGKHFKLICLIVGVEGRKHGLLLLCRHTNGVERNILFSGRFHACQRFLKVFRIHLPILLTFRYHGCCRVLSSQRWAFASTPRSAR